jgi:hypothetical protein
VSAVAQAISTSLFASSGSRAVTGSRASAMGGRSPVRKWCGRSGWFSCQHTGREGCSSIRTIALGDLR